MIDLPHLYENNNLKKLKEKTCQEYGEEKLGEEIKNSSQKLSEILEKLTKSIDDFNTSTSKSANSQEKLQKWLCRFTLALVIVGALQLVFFYSKF